MAVKYLNLDGEFKGYTLYYHDPVLPDGPSWVLENESGLVFVNETWADLLSDPHMSDEDLDYIERLAGHCDDCFNNRFGQVCDDPERKMGEEVFNLACSWGWVKKKKKEEEDDDD